MQDFILGVIVGVLVGAIVVFTALSYTLHKTPVQLTALWAPAPPRILLPELYSKDGCWVRDQQGYWHPKRRCHVIPNERN